MKGPKDKKSKQPKGGKALERLRQFERERGLDETAEDKPIPDEPLTKDADDEGNVKEGT